MLENVFSCIKYADPAGHMIAQKSRGKAISWSMRRLMTGRPTGKQTDLAKTEQRNGKRFDPDSLLHFDPAADLPISR